MKSLWNDKEASGYMSDLEQRIYTSRLLGRDKSLVLHGGGNTSVKIRRTNRLGDEVDYLFVKGSGWDLEAIDAPGFPAVRLDHLVRLAQLESLSDPEMVNELKTNMADASSPTPSVEAILHAILPYRYVDHTHADAVIAVTNTADGRRRIADIYGDEVVVIPYVMPGFDLARLCATEFEKQRNARTIGMVLMNHGVFSFGDTARESYERMIALVTRAEEYLKQQRAWTLPSNPGLKAESRLAPALAALRRDLSMTAGFPMVMHTHATPETLAFARRADVAELSRQGPATPDHVIRTRRVPLLGRDVAGYAAEYKIYFQAHASRAKEPKSMLDPAPRVVLDPAFGLASAGRSAAEALIVRDIYLHTIEIIQRAALLGGYRALPAGDIFDVEYWDLEQAKLKKAGKAPVFAGEVVLITGAASGIGKACVEAFLERGAAVVGLDINTTVGDAGTSPAYLGIVCDVTDGAAVEAALERAVRAYGGLDMLVLNAGVFPPGCAIAQTDFAEWQRVLDINLNANLRLMTLCHPLLRLAPDKGRVVVVGSKNVSAPGPGAAAYSASKAALTQLMRIAALEWAAEGIRINAVHPDAVFDTGVWTPEVLAARAKSYGMTVEQYRRRNLMQAEITSRDVAGLVAEMCGPLFAKTTAAQLPVDGGDVRVI